jgi:hypothetical protein
LAHGPKAPPRASRPAASPPRSSTTPLHALGSRLFGFTQEILNDCQDLDPRALKAIASQMEGSYPNVAVMTRAVYHDEASAVGGGRDDQFEFEFALDLLLDGLDRLR